MPSSTTGKLSTSNLVTRGPTISSGSSLISSCSVAWTSTATASMSDPQSKLTRTLLLPSYELEVSSTTPGTVATISSTIWVTRRSITTGSAPSYWVRTVSVGSSMLGSRSICSRLSATVPSTSTINVTISVNTGRRTAARARFMASRSPCRA